MSDRPASTSFSLPDLNAFAAILLDLDGTVYHEEHALPGAIDLIRRLQREGRTYACLTNSTSSPERLSARLRRMGVEVDPAHIYTAAAATCDYVMQRFGARPDRASTGPRVFNLSTEAVQEMLEGRVRWVQRMDEACDAVICGVPLNVYATEERQRTAMVLLRGGAALVGICADRVYPSQRGMEFGVGAMAAMLAYAADVRPVFCGKPEELFFRELCRRIATPPERCLLVGDNLESDIAGAKAVRMQTVLTFTGVSAQPDIDRLPADHRPEWVIQDLRELL